jgi:N-glycosylase/DNA lyase
MNVKLPTLNRTIDDLCQYLGEIDSVSLNWEALSDDNLFHEAVICIIGSQMLYEVSLLLANRLQDKGVLEKDFIRKNANRYESILLKIFSEKIEFSDCEGKERYVSPRFKNRLSSLLSVTGKRLYVEGPTLMQLLCSARDGRDARETLVKKIAGFGPKQASLFLRRVGYCTKLAVLDVHVLDYLKLARGIKPKPHFLSSVSSYERLENEFYQVATDFGHAVGYVDLAMWVTMRVAKREFAT